ncbi:hypothetical protein MKJ04_04000 [Pontibacter sp. E15-1]|uniref:hypothetical protein n=1 Tax=Pontibacter sp. E15-1 TaxID=2919918 RepID=UPI001F4F6FB9|nr:hypothetical protein [Pontibacter sp. E15-1]MCJ8163992.1 hypothetical protein [Pontibacter sp. E15-1]
MIKMFLVTFIIFVVVVSFIIILPIRTTWVMKIIAESELEDVLMNDTLEKKLSGPIVSDKGEYLKFKWYDTLEWGDTAAIYVDVYKNPFNSKLRNFLWPRTTMNYQWNYFLFPNGIGKFSEVLNDKHFNSIDFQLHQEQGKINDSTEFTIAPERLLFFLKKGYFTVIEKQDRYTAVDFFEPVAKISDNTDTLLTMGAKIYVTNSAKVLIAPCDLTNKYNISQ